MAFRESIRPRRPRAVRAPVSEGGPTIRAMDLTPTQRRTLDGLIQPGRSRAVPPDLPERLRTAIESSLQVSSLPPGGLRLFKQRMNDLDRCEGLFRAVLAANPPPFQMWSRPAAGMLLHKAIELDVGGREQAQPWVLAQRAGTRLGEDPRFGRFWELLGRPAQDELLMEVVRGVELFRATFPPLAPLRSSLAPVTELRMRAELWDGRAMLTGSVDLMMHRPASGRATRLLIDLKGGGARPEHPEDMRLYALLFTLRFGVPPLRVATLFLTSGEWQVEEVSDRTLFHAVDRVVEAARAAGRLTARTAPVLRAGPYCRWCPARASCPAAEGAA